jgi:hypothetical protein
MVRRLLARQEIMETPLIHPSPTPRAAAVVSQLAAWGFAYVENLTWVWRAPNNGVLALPGHAPTAGGHLTLLIFRREGGRPRAYRAPRKRGCIRGGGASRRGRPAGSCGAAGPAAGFRVPGLNLAAC